MRECVKGIQALSKRKEMTGCGGEGHWSSIIGQSKIRAVCQRLGNYLNCKHLCHLGPPTPSQIIRIAASFPLKLKAFESWKLSLQDSGASADNELVRVQDC